MVAADGEAAPAGADRPPPEPLGRPGIPVRIERRPVERPRPGGPQKSWKILRRLGPRRRPHRDGRRYRLRQQPVACRAPTKRQLRHQVARHTFDPQGGTQEPHEGHEPEANHPFEPRGVPALEEKPEQHRHRGRKTKDQRDDVPHRRIDDSADERLEQPHADHRRRGGERREANEDAPRRPERPLPGCGGRRSFSTTGHDTLLLEEPRQRDYTFPPGQHPTCASRLPDS